MSFNLIKEDPLTGTNFFLEIDGSIISNVTSVDGLSLEIEVADFTERTDKGKIIQHKLMSKPKWAGELTIKRIAPLNSEEDALWKWFNQLRDKGMNAKNRSDGRKHGSIVVYDSMLNEIARWNFYDAWPSKIDSDGLETSKNDVVSETITLQYEKLERKK